MNHHFANTGDVMKHLALCEVLDEVRPAGYLESHAGGFTYPLVERDGPLVDGIWDFLRACEASPLLEGSAYGRVVQRLAGSEAAPGTYPGSARLALEILGRDARYTLFDTDPVTTASLTFGFREHGASARVETADGVRGVLKNYRYGDVVLIDPFVPDAGERPGWMTPTDAFGDVVSEGVTALLWRPLSATSDPEPPVGAEMGIRLWFDEPVGSMVGCDLSLGAVPEAAAARVAAMAVAHGFTLSNGRVEVWSAKPWPRDDWEPDPDPPGAESDDQPTSVPPVGAPEIAGTHSASGEGPKLARPGTVVAVGVDGCPAGWVAALAIEGGPVEVHVFATIDDLARDVRARSDDAVIAIDVPIGLPERPSHRPCDKQARALLKSPDKALSREGSVFQVPDRELIGLKSFEDVQEVVAARKAADATAKGISKQSFAIAPKIFEVDAFVRRTPGCEQWLVEVHPEVCFREMSGPGGPLFPKAKPEGRAQRRTLLSTALAEFGITLPDPVPKIAGAKHDDVLDAFVSLWTAMRHRVGIATILGGERDNCGVTMRMVV